MKAAEWGEAATSGIGSSTGFILKPQSLLLWDLMSVHRFQWDFIPFQDLSHSVIIMHHFNIYRCFFII